MKSEMLGAMVLTGTPYKLAAFFPVRPEFAAAYSAAEGARKAALEEWREADDYMRRQLGYACDCEGE